MTIVAIDAIIAIDAIVAIVAINANHILLISTIVYSLLIYPPKKTIFEDIYKKRESILSNKLSLKTAATYSPTMQRSTIGASGLNFSVRNGKRWNPTAITT